VGQTAKPWKAFPKPGKAKRSPAVDPFCDVLDGGKAMIWMQMGALLPLGIYTYYFDIVCK